MASCHTTAKPGKRAQPGPRPSDGGKIPRAVRQCAFCDGGHRSGDCAVYTDADSRLKVVKETVWPNIQWQSAVPVTDV